MTRHNQTMAMHTPLSTPDAHQGHTGEHVFYQRCVDILRCTAQALCHSPGGFRFRANSRPWLEGLGVAQAGKAALRTAA